MPRRFALLAPALLASALAVTATISAQDKPADKPAAKPTAPAASPAAGSTLPSAASILDKSVVALGGKDAWSKLQSIDLQGTIEVPGQGLKGSTQAMTAQPNKMINSMNIAGVGDFRTGFDGKVGWAIDKISGPRLLEGAELETILREADFMKDLEPTKRWDKIETVGEGDFGGFTCWKLEGTKGAIKSTLWFEKESGLQRGFETTVDTQLGKIPVSTVIKEYRPFEGPFGKVNMPVRTEATQMGQKMITAVTAATFNTTAATAFDLPTEIKALLEPEPTEEGETAKPAAAPTAPATPTTTPAAAPTAPAAAPTAPAAAPTAPAAAPTTPAAAPTKPSKQG